MLMIKQQNLFQLGLCLIGGLRAVQETSPSDIIDGESKLIETVGFISCNFKVKAIVHMIIEI